MSSYSSVYVESERLALRHLSGTDYRVLRYLATRADIYGRCFPSVETIANDLGMVSQTVYKSLDRLESCGYVVYLRRNQRDMLTGKHLPNVYLLNPHYHCVRDENFAETKALWLSVSLQLLLPNVNELAHNGSEREGNSPPLDTNQQQEPTTVTNDSEPTAVTNNNNQRTHEKQPVQNFLQPMPETAKNEKSETAKTPTAKPKKTQGSAIVKKFTDPTPQPTAFADSREAISQSIMRLGIVIALARGFVNLYGVNKCQTALIFISRQSDVKNAAGMFRYLIQNDLTGV